MCGYFLGPGKKLNSLRSCYRDEVLKKCSSTSNQRKNEKYNRAIEEICRNPRDAVAFGCEQTAKSFFRKDKKTFSRCDLGECVYRISGLHRFSVGQRM